jgi:hypothetical protein
MKNRETRDGHRAARARCTVARLDPIASAIARIDRPSAFSR